MKKLIVPILMSFSSVFAFNYDEYKVVDIDLFLKKTNLSESNGMSISFDNGGRVQFDAKLITYARPCTKNIDNLFSMLVSVTGKDVQDLFSVCIIISTPKGTALEMPIQAQVADYLPKEAKLQSSIRFFGALALYLHDPSRGRPLLLINEYKTK